MAKRELGRGVAVFGVIALVIALVGSAVAWWRWERITFIEGDIPLPPATETVKIESPEVSSSGLLSYTMRVRGEAEFVREFYRRHLANDGWSETASSPERIRFDKDKRVIRLVIHPQKRFTVFNLNIK